jgi:hypothetical protein
MNIGVLRLLLAAPEPPRGSHCPIALFPATSEREKIHFHQLNRRTGNRIQYRKVDSETGREVDKEDIIKAYEKSKGAYSGGSGFFQDTKRRPKTN